MPACERKFVCRGSRKATVAKTVLRVVEQAQVLQLYEPLCTVKVVHSKSIDKLEPSLTLRVALNKKLAQVDLKYIGGQDLATSEHVDASIEWVYEYINELLFIKLGKTKCPKLRPNPDTRSNPAPD